MKYIFANWKSHKNAAEAAAWAKEFAGFFKEFSAIHSAETQIIVFPSFIHLASFSYQVPGLALGVQTLSPYPTGAYTGVVAARMVSDYATFALLGHAERRQFFHETDTIVANQAIQAIENGLTPILAIDDANWSSQLSQLSAEQIAQCLVMYEPPSAISTAVGGGASDIESVREAAALIQQNYPVKGVIYGGSVNAANVARYMQEPGLSGAGVGAASLDAKEFIGVIKAAVD